MNADRFRRAMWGVCGGLLLGTFAFASVQGKDSASDAGSDKARASRKALEEFNPLIGGWRGVGQPQRGSVKGSWSEKGEWLWEIKKQHAAIRYEVTDGKLLSSAVVTYDTEKQLYVLEAVLPDKTQRRYEGKLTGNKLTFDSAADSQGRTHQIQLTRLSDKRTLILYQSRQSEQESFTRVAEVGYTREGTKLAVEGAGEPECIVTGGKGTMTTVYKGKTYYFCCTGCRDAFNDDPEGIIAEAAEKAKKKAAEASGK